MAILVALEHYTAYHFDRPVRLGPHVVRLRPAPHCRTPISAYSFTVTPAEHFVNWQQDVFGNQVARLVFPEPTTELTIKVGLIADLTSINPMDFFVEPSASTFPFTYDAELADDLEPYLRPIASTQVAGWTRDHVAPAGTPIVDMIAMLNQRIAGDVAYTVRMEHGVQTPDETLSRRIGSCRDSAWLLVAALRELGLAARFVSGYLVQLRPDAAPGQVADGPAQDFTDLHAWAEVYIPGAGWIGLDATSGLFASEGHIPLSATPHPGHSAPVTGTIGFAQTTMEFHNLVSRIHEDPRTTAPYTTEQWQRVMDLGHRVDASLDAGDVRLTMGGEPTFVSRSDVESAQWHIAADGVGKRELAVDLARRLKEHYAPGGMIFRGQGKWYPGEPLPRWQVGMTWRTDGVPIWRDPKLIDEPWDAPLLEPGSPETQERTRAVATAIAGRLGIDPDRLLPAFEDPLQQLADEARLPAGPRPEIDLDPDALLMPDLRAAALQRLSRPDGAPRGWVLPMSRSADGEGWALTTWTFRRGALLLMPGTSPVGLRLPLDAISWTEPDFVPQRSPFAPETPLDDEPSPVVEAPDVPRTALCVEERDGHVFVFLPPVEDLAWGLELVRAVEDAAAATSTPVVLEGYSLPYDPRTRTLTVTPDPGVIEVNVHPTSTWDEQVEVTMTLAILGHDVGLSTEKFTLDGTHTGTGGGSHLTLGGTRPADSPLLRRPDLLVSMLTFWQNHPSLSYLFSGQFIGPTSQAPRVDEARHETLYELEIAFAELARLGEETLPWQVDRALRHLLTDVTGNTHRAEFCIDKLYSPDSDRGRLGLLELRGFEMAPHPQMALVQALLVRALVARFWEQPYDAGLVRWGTELHDRWLLPHFIAADIDDVAADLRAHGFAVESAWFDPFLEFRFPRLGQVEVAGVGLELRSAIEPWHVLGEEVSGSGTARYVDSSVERLQLRVTGATTGRHVVTCNGVPVPLHPTGTPGTSVAGVRYRAWSPWSALHPTIDVHAPLVFDVVDRWSARSLGGCTYHVVHPGGRSYERFPVNAGEAEARRTARFVPHGHSTGEIDLDSLVVPETGLDEFPRTLDLRRRVPGR